MQSIPFNIATIRAAIFEAEARAGRSRGSVTLMGVSKTRTADEIEQAVAAGVRHLGENYLQDALPKIETLSHLDAVWHFIGSIQSNKTRDIARHFQWVHTIDRDKIAHRLNEAREAPDGAQQGPLDVCVQVNIDEEPQKAGVKPDAAAALVALISGLSNLRLRGLMTIPRAQPTAEATRPSFRRLAELFEALSGSAGPCWNTLSMGMTADFEVAIEEGATMVRVGTALFGPRLSKERH